VTAHHLVGRHTNSSQFTRNEARISPTLRSLFPAGAVTVEMRAAGDAAALLPAEAACVGRAVPTRVQEFAAGRCCARRALAEFGIVDFAVRAAADRQPIWPKSMVGSITHTDGLCAAVVAPSHVIAAIGMDCEVVGKVSCDIWPTICGVEEAAWVGSLANAARSAAVAVLFSAKEAFYKCQYPLTGEWLDFHDLRIAVESWALPSGRFTVQPARSLAVAALGFGQWVGRYLFHEEFVAAGFALPRSSAGAQ
jgi:4'-phosphopantetheinyl transferase EntD